jgi:hypothetical protein
MREPTVTCQGCHFTWHSEAMAEGLRLMGRCPRCGGELAFHAEVGAAAMPEAERVRVDDPARVLGIPRRA